MKRYYILGIFTILIPLIAMGAYYGQKLGPNDSPEFVGITVSGLTASRAVQTDASSDLESSAVTTTELGYLSGVTGTQGTGDLVLDDSPALTTPDIGTPSAGTLTNCDGLPMTTGVTGILPVANGGTNSNTALNNDRVIVSSGGAIVESGTVTTTELAHLNGIASVTTGAGDNDKLVTQGYVDDSIGAAGGGDVTGVTAGDGIRVDNGDTATPDVHIDFDENTTNLEGTAIATADVLLYMDSDNTDDMARGLVSDLPFQSEHAYLTDLAGITANQGDIIYFNGTDWVDLAPGTNGYFLQTQGAAANPQWAAGSSSGADEVYGVGWAADSTAPEKDDVYDYLHQIDSDDDGVLTDETWFDIDNLAGTNEAGLYALLSDVSDFVQPAEVDVEMLADVTGEGTAATYSLFDDNDGTYSFRAIADGDVPDDITIDLATLATTLTVTDNEATSETNAVLFTAGGALTGGNLGIESDGDLNYNPSNGTLSATQFSGGGAGVTGVTAAAGDSATSFFSSGTIETARGGAGTDLSGMTGVMGMNAGTYVDIDTAAELETYAGLGGYASTILGATIDSEANFKAAVNLEAGTDFVAPSGSGASLTGIPLDSDFSSNGLMKRTGAGTYGIAVDDTDYFKPGGAAGVSATEFGYISTVSSNVQTQLDGKQSTLTNSEGLRTALSDETGTGLAVFATSPSLATPTINTSLTVTDDDWIGIGAAAERIEFDDAGDVNILGANVGILTSAPTRDLHISYSSSSSVTTASPAIRVENTYDSTGGEGDFSFAALELSSDAGGLVASMFADGSGYFTSGTRALVFRATEGASNGFLKLDSDGDVTASGCVTSEGSCTADYVFNDDYPLATLDELDNHIKEKSSLPGMTINNTDRLNFNKAIHELLVKVEEQSRYILQLHARIKKLEGK